MITLIRPVKSKLADKIESRLKKAYTSYKVVHKHISDITYLVESGQVFQEDAIMKYLDEQFKRYTPSKSIVADDKFFS